jgi:hypothetical protein
MGGAISLVDLLDMRGRSEKHFPHTLLHSRSLVALFQGGEQLLMSLHNIADVAHQLTVLFFRQTVQTHKNDDAYNIPKCYFVLQNSTGIQNTCSIYSELEKTSHHLTCMGKGMYQSQEPVGCMTETLKKSNTNQNSILSCGSS